MFTFLSVLQKMWKIASTDATFGQTLVQDFKHIIMASVILNLF